MELRLLRDAQHKFVQFIMATHAVEIINEAAPDEIVSIDAKLQSGKRVKTEGDYTALLQYIGSAENIDFARIARAKRVIFVEGKDGKLLRRFASKFDFPSLANPKNAPIVQLGGVSEWRRAAHTVWAFRKILDMEIKAFCIFDRDYRTDEEIAAFLSTAAENDFFCEILELKEIENYLLAPDALTKSIQARLAARKSGQAIERAQVDKWLREAAGEVKGIVYSRRIAEALRSAAELHSKVSPATIIEKTTEKLDDDWKDLAKRLQFSPGKDVLSKFNGKVQAALGVSLTEAIITSHMSRKDAPQSLISLLARLEEFSS